MSARAEDAAAKLGTPAADPAAPDPAAPDPRDDHAGEVRLWLRLLAVTNLIEAEIRRRLRDNFATTLPRFDLLAQLERAPDGILLGELSRRMMVSNGNITGLVERLTQEGLITRETPATDRRAVRVSLTEEGRIAFAAMATEHAGWVGELLAGLSTAERDALAQNLTSLKASVTSATEGPTNTRTGDA